MHLHVSLECQSLDGCVALHERHDSVNIRISFKGSECPATLSTHHQHHTIHRDPSSSRPSNSTSIPTDTGYHLFSTIPFFPIHRQEKLESLNLSLMKIMLPNYEQYHYDKERLRQSAELLGTLEVPVTDLEQVRVLINKYCSEQPDSPKLSPDWVFIDCKFRRPSITPLH